MKIAALSRGIGLAHGGGMTRHGRQVGILAGITLSLAATGCVGGALSGDENRNELGIQCEAALRLEGSFTATQAQPADVFGCWPVGTWRFTATVTQTDCSAAPALEQEYTFEVTRDAEEAYHIAFVNNPSSPFLKMKVSGDGGGMCSGGFEIFSADSRTVTNLKPMLQANGILAGHGEVIVYEQAKM
jgi:hypothetical protein